MMLSVFCLEKTNEEESYPLCCIEISMSFSRLDLELIDHAIIQLYRMIWNEVGNGDSVKDDDLRRVVPEFVTQASVSSALSILCSFRNYKAHYDYDNIDFFEVGNAISTACQWIKSIIDQDQMIEETLLPFRLAASLCFRWLPRHNGNIEDGSYVGNQKKENTREEGLEEAQLGVDARLYQLKDRNKHRAKGAKIIILSGWHMGREATILSWRGTACNVTLAPLQKEGEKKITLPLQIRVRVISWGNEN
jgi:hypothetical protein